MNDSFKNQSAGYLMNHIARQFAILLSEGLKPLGIAPAQFPILIELWNKDGLSQQELVERADLKQATIANTLARMERDGLITREPSTQPFDYADRTRACFTIKLHRNCQSHQPRILGGSVGRRAETVFGNGTENYIETTKDDKSLKNIKKAV